MPAFPLHLAYDRCDRQSRLGTTRLMAQHGGGTLTPELLRTSLPTDRGGGRWKRSA